VRVPTANPCQHNMRTILLGRVVRRYNELLLAKPYRTKMASSTIIMSSAELISQHLCGSSQQPTVCQASSDPTALTLLGEGFRVGHLNIGHGITFGLLHGACFNAPLLHTFFQHTAHWHLAARCARDPVPCQPQPPQYPAASPSCPMTVLAWARLGLNHLVIDPLNYCSAMVMSSIAHGDTAPYPCPRPLSAAPLA
jgi:hypothetical protein